MTPEILAKLLEYIDSRISEHAARYSSDGGLLESIATDGIRNELGALVDELNLNTLRSDDEKLPHTRN